MTASPNPRKSQLPQSRVKQRTSNVLVRTIFIVLTVTLCFYLYLQTRSDTGYFQNPKSGRSNNSNALSSSPDASTTQKIVPLEKNKESQHSGDLHNTSAPSPQVNGAHGGDTLNPSTIGAITESFESGSQDDPLKVYIDQLNAFYTHLDNQQYMQNFNIGEPSREHFSKLIQKLLDNPPVVTRETDDLFTLLKNTAHFFRILGKENILILKGILDREKESLEDMFGAYFELTATPSTLENEYHLDLSQDSLYDYAVFLINTMGGRLYLFRRDSSSRMAVTYYAIRLIDRAVSEGNSRHGMDIRPALLSLTEEMENGGKRLKYREQYLDVLYDLQEKYN